MLDWPSYLPNPTTSFKLDATPNIERTQMSSGYRRQRNRDIRNTYQASIVWEMSSAEFELFKYFHQNVLNDGNDWFNCPIPENGTVQTQQARIVNGKYTVQYMDFMFFRVTIKADVKEVSLPSEDYMNLILSPDFPENYWSSGVLEALELCVNGENL